VPAVTWESKLDRAIGGKAAAALEKAFGLETVGDLLTYFPRSLQDTGELTDFSSLRLGEHVTVVAKVLKVDNIPYTIKGTGKRAVRTTVSVTDGEREMSLTFFKQAWRKDHLAGGTIAMVSGDVSVFNGRRQLTHPKVEVLGRGADLDEFADIEVPRWIPIYPATASISSETIRSCVGQTLGLIDEVPDPVPDDVRTARGLIGYDAALRAIHGPQEPADDRRARTRLRFDEAFLLQTVLAQRRAATAKLSAVSRARRGHGLAARFESAMPFELTTGQQSIGAEISADLAAEHPMHRLLQGEVGSGKTLVALRAMLQVVDSGGQAALLAPTEVLAAQHHRSIVAMLGPLAEPGMLGGDLDGTQVELLTGSQSTPRRRAALLNVQSGAAGIVIGTHALLEEKVRFAELGLVVVDEQHRFGVEQRAALTAKAGEATPHVLVMTATPIPRTVAMTVFGDLDVSTLRELPPGRSPIQSSLVPAAQRPDWLERAWQRVREEVASGQQAYVVCPRIDGDAREIDDDRDGAGPDPPDADLRSEQAPGQSTRRPPLAVLDVVDQLRARQLAGLRLDVLHGRLPGEEKDAVMRRFGAGEIDVLVATTVVEVGLDVPNASVMVVLDADRFGASQLHQLRGRVGRGAVPGLCLLVTEAEPDSPAAERVSAVAATTDGFELARLDLEHRREGDVLGARQSGRRSSLKLLSVLRHEDVIQDARLAASQVVAEDPSLAGHPALARAVAALAAEETSYLEKS